MRYTYQYCDETLNENNYRCRRIVNWDAIGAIGENIGALAVIISVLYLAYQVKLGATHARANTQHQIVKDLQEHQSRLIDNPNLFRRGYAGLSNLTDDEKLAFGTYFAEVVSTFESTLRLQKAGLVDDTIYKGHRAFMLALIQTPGGVEWWSQWKGLFSADVSEYVEKQLRDRIDLPPSVTESIRYFSELGSE